MRFSIYLLLANPILANSWLVKFDHFCWYLIGVCVRTQLEYVCVGKLPYVEGDPRPRWTKSTKRVAICSIDYLALVQGQRACRPADTMVYACEFRMHANPRSLLTGVVILDSFCANISYGPVRLAEKMTADVNANLLWKKNVVISLKRYG